ncbi:ankyrin repeat-containing domain protein [Hypoxylon sp. NC1633]|nr:ankyrin repeat-containing domain protein [Hypoxylon sp. NC1633]
MALFLTLPNELLLDIIGQLDDPHDLSSISATSRLLHYVANPFLYAFAAKNRPYLLFWASEFGRVSTAEKLLLAGQDPNIPMIEEDHGRCYAQFKDEANTDLDPITSQRIEEMGNYVWRRWGENDCESPENNGLFFSYHSSGPNYPWTCPLPMYWFPIHLAAISGSVDMIKLLVDYGARIQVPSCGLCLCSATSGVYDGENHPSYQDGEGIPRWSPLHTALCRGKEAAANLLLDLGASPEVELRANMSNALHWAASSGCLSTVKTLLEKHQVPADINDSVNSTPLMWTLGASRSFEIIECLLQHGASTDLEMDDRDEEEIRQPTALSQACANGWYEDAIQLIEAGADIHRVLPVLKLSPLDLCLRVLGADWYRLGGERSGNWYAPWSLVNEFDMIQQCQDDNRRRYISRLWRMGYQLQLWAKETSQLPLYEDNGDIYFSGMIQLVKLLILRGANIHGSPAAPSSVLMRASAAHLVPIVDLLLASGESVDQEDAEGITPLLAALLSTNLPWIDTLYETVRPLINHGAHPNQKNTFGETVFFRRLCCEPPQKDWHSERNLELVKALVSYGADVNLRSPVRRRHDGTVVMYSPIQAAFYYKHYDICRYLLEIGAEISSENHDLRIMLEDSLYGITRLSQPLEEQEPVEKHYAYGGVAGVQLMLEMHRRGRLS